jgi:tetratricopeptide (TPR) repeat protein
MLVLWALLLAGCAAPRAGSREAELSSRDVLAVLDAERRAVAEGPRAGAERYAALRTRHPDDPFLRTREAQLWFEARETARAKALLAAPGSIGAAAHLVLGEIAVAEHRAADALAHFEAARRLAPEDPRALSAFVELHVELGRLDRAASLIDRMIDDVVLPLPLLELRLKIAAGHDDAKAITRTAERIVATYPARSRTLVARASELLESAPEHSLALLAAVPHTLEVTGFVLSAREALRRRKITPD